MIVARVCEYVVAIDMSPEMLTIAREKGLPPDRVEFSEGDAYSLESVSGTFNAGLASFWLSHVPKARINRFLRGFHERIGIDAVVFMADNVYVPGIGREVVRRPGTEDTFKLRKLSDGSKHEVLKNYYGARDLNNILSRLSSDLQVHVGRCFWWVRYVVV